MSMEMGEQVTQKSIASISCQDHLDEFRRCTQNSGAKSKNLEKCTKIMNKWRYCLA